MRSLIASVMLVLGFSAIACCQLYEWTDDSGNLNFTDDRDNIPAKYRNSVKTRDETIKGEPESRGIRGDSAVQPVPARVRRPDLYDGHTLDWWRRGYVERHERLESLKTRIESLKTEENEARRKLVILQRPADRRALNLKSVEVADIEAQVDSAQKELDDFSSQAESLGISMEMLKGEAP